MNKSPRKALLLSIGYGEGHHAAARATAEELERRGWRTLRMDPCAETHPAIFRLTQRFYHFCVRRAPWLWGVTYAQTDTADWASGVRLPLLRDCCERLGTAIQNFAPDVIICTYPLFAYMADWLRMRGRISAPCVVIVTDSLEISRPWMLSNAELICLPDEHSQRMVQERYGLSPRRLAVSGFPVRPAFRRGVLRLPPTPLTLGIVYGVYAPTWRALDDLRGLLRLFPHARLTVLAGERTAKMRHALRREESEAGTRLKILEREEDMPALFAASHLYIGKAGAATLFEAYSSQLPCIVNYALPGQEQGNLALLLEDGAGLAVDSTAALLQAVSSLMADGAAGWSALAAAMNRPVRHHGAERTADIIEQHLSRHGN